MYLSTIIDSLYTFAGAVKQQSNFSLPLGNAVDLVLTCPVSIQTIGPTSPIGLQYHLGLHMIDFAMV